MKLHTFHLISDSSDCGIIIYSKDCRTEILRQAFLPEHRIGKQQNMILDMEPYREGLYQFYEGDRRFPDPKAHIFFSALKYGEPKREDEIYSVLPGSNTEKDFAGKADFDWENTKCPRIPYQDAMVYCLHVRGFTKHASSKVSGRGTFEGVISKIPYLKELGITTLEFQPLYEFNEKCFAESHSVPSGSASLLMDGRQRSLPLNYWGYTQGYYYAPKAGYASQDPVQECKKMIRELHRNGMEAILQFYFPKNFNPMEIPDILHYWVKEYHADGFHLLGEDLPIDWIALDPILADTKIWYYRFDEGRLFDKHSAVGAKNLAFCRDDALYDFRRFLKGEENTIPGVMYHLRCNPSRIGQIHYLSTYWGFTMMDMVSYDFKHNEANGEENHDGTDYNCSWNCGEEGVSRKKKVTTLRSRQMKNAYCLLMLSQSVPRIFMGDEFGNSQKGNNNPYCQDNEITWLNWKDLERNRELFSFFRMLADLRKKVPVLHMKEESVMMDTLSCGYPDLSYHGQTAWRPQTEGYSRQLGVLFCGKYGQDASNELTDTEDHLYYLAMNMHCEPHELALPRLPKEKCWKMLFTTASDTSTVSAVGNPSVIPIDETENRFPASDTVKIPPRTMSFYVSTDKSEQGITIQKIKE